MNSVKNFFVLSLLCILSTGAFAQDDDPTLFTVEDMDVSLSEFKYIYEKNNRDGADYSKASLDEYLDLYAKFKLKVVKAKELQFDTIQALQIELEGYRKQLAKSYLNDKEVTDKLSLQLYERLKEDIHVSHILFRTKRNGTSAEEVVALEKANAALAMLKNGESFEDIARELTEDKSTVENGGDLGFLTAMLPNGFYDMENAIYALEVDELSDPVKSPLGYHILKVIAKRPARGKIEVSHILSRIKDDRSNVHASKIKIDGIYQSLLNGRVFEDMARSVSDDQRTAKRGGYLGKISINLYDPVFEEAAYGISKEGGISEPVLTRIGWHIIKLIKKIQLGTYESEKKRLIAQMTGDDRMDVARRAMINAIKAESGYKVDSAKLNAFVLALDETFQSFKWSIPKLEEGDVITFSDGSSKTMLEFAEFAHSETRQRMRAQSIESMVTTAHDLFTQFSDDACLGYEEKYLTEKYPDFGSLMREYDEGILLFEVTKMMVWDMASNDTLGLVAFHESHKEDYVWPELAKVASYTVKSSDAKVIEKAFKSGINDAPEDWKEQLDKKEVIAFYEISEMSREDVEAAGYQWRTGWNSPLFQDPAGKATFTRVIEVTPSRLKELNEARGYIIADYQDYLEKEWVKNLSEEYEVLVNEELFESLIQE